MHSELPRASNSDPRFLLWVSPVDSNGTSADPMFLQAAEAIGGDFVQYRAHDVNDPSRSLELAERAVHLASRAKKKRPVEDAVRYLFRTFTNLVDHEINRRRRFVHLDDDRLHTVVQRRDEESEAIEQSITWREALETLDPKMRWVLWRLYWGFSVNEIADQLGISPNTLSQRIRRARKHLKKILDRTPQVGATSVDGRQTNGRISSERAGSRRGFPSAGAGGIKRPSQS